MAKKQTSPAKSPKRAPIILPAQAVTQLKSPKGSDAKTSAILLTPKTGKSLGTKPPLIWKGNFIAIKQAVQDVDSSKNKADWVRSKIKIAIYEDETLKSVKTAGGKDDFLLAKPTTQDGDIPVDDRDDVAWQMYRLGERLGDPCSTAPGWSYDYEYRSPYSNIGTSLYDLGDFVVGGCVPNTPGRSFGIFVDTTRYIDPSALQALVYPR